MRRFFSLARHGVRYSPMEWIVLACYAVVFGSFVTYPLVYVSSMVYAFIVLVLLTWVEKYVSLVAGATCEIKFSVAGLFTSIVLSVLIGFPVFVPPGVALHRSSRHILGYNYPYVTSQSYAFVAVCSLSTGLVIALLSMTWLDWDVFGRVILFIVAYSLVPWDFFINYIDKKAGMSIAMSIIFRSRTMYVFMLVFTVAIVLTSLSDKFLLGLLFSVCFATLMGLWYFLYQEPTLVE